MLASGGLRPSVLTLGKPCPTPALSGEAAATLALGGHCPFPLVPLAEAATHPSLRSSPEREDNLLVEDPHPVSK